MQMVCLLVVCVLSLILMIGGTVIDERVCVTRGYDSTALMCSSCESLQLVVGDEELYKECQECCQPDRVEAKYEQAVLEVDKRFLSGLPEVQAVVKMKNKLNLDVRYSFGARPTLLMFKEEGDDLAEERISVYGWDKETFVEYLKGHLSS